MAHDVAVERAHDGAGPIPPGPVARVLVVDDEESVALTLSRMVGAAGHEVRWTSDPVQFMSLHDEWRPTHVVLDLAMPDVDGIELLRRLADHGSHASVIISSGVGTRVLDAAGRVAADHGLQLAGLMPKPYRLDTVAELLGRRADAPAPEDVVAPLPRVQVDDLAGAVVGRPGCGTLAVAFQPKVDLRTGAVAGFEALARWDHPELGPIPPEEFVAVAEARGLVDALTDRILEMALGWATTLPGGISMSVNVSGLTVADASFATRERERSERLGLDTQSVVLELTETRALQEPETALRTLTSLRLAGFALSIDDFGTGHSSLSQLAHLPFSEIKVDRSFVGAMCAHEESRALVRSVIDLGREMGLVTVAEGVEDRETLRALHAMGCDLVQGFLICRPLPPQEAQAWLTAWDGRELLAALEGR